MKQKPLDRLAYYNGQRLDAPALKLEQEYHIRVRRCLNRSLYSPGIARGLEVRAEPAGVPTVVVSPGLALDADGREIILLQEERVTVVGEGSAVPGRVSGNYLTIQYRERTEAEEQDGCFVPPGGRHPASHPAWGGPGRVRAEPILDWSDVLPHEGSGRVVLAQVELDATCQAIRTVHVGARQYVGAASEARVRQYALEGEKDLDPLNSKRLYFHIRGRQPSSVTLYLRAEKLPSLYYSELGQHNHAISVTVDDLDIPAHAHGTAAASTAAGANHSHGVGDVTADTDWSVWWAMLGSGAGSAWLTADVGLALWTSGAAAALGVSSAAIPGARMALTLSPEALNPVYFKNDPLKARVGINIPVDNENQHTHPIDASTTGSYPADGSDWTFQQSGSGSSANAGVTAPSSAYEGHDGAPLAYFGELQVLVDGVDQTQAVIRQLKDVRPPSESWDKLGDTTATHALVDRGTGPIRLHFLPGVAFGEGEHCVELKPKTGGGRVLYNLYVE